MKKGGLSIGIEELMGMTGNNPDFTSYDEHGNLNQGVEEVSIDRVIPNAGQPRKQFDQTALEELAASIRNYGVLQPILVCKIKDQYQIVAGERRYRASKMAGLTTIPVIVRDLSLQQRKEIALIENLQRQDLNPIEEALAYRALIEEYKFTQEELADKLGKSRPAIANSMRLLTLPKQVLDLIAAGRLSAGHARCLVPVKEIEMQIKYANAACDKQLSVRQLETIVQNHLKPAQPKPVKTVLSVELKKFVNDMQRAFGTKVKVVGNNNTGRIYIDYYSQDDLNRFFDLLDKLKD
mgnify:CR=1 FL=1